MNFVKAIFVSICFFLSSTAFAGSGHYHGPIDQAAAEVKAEKAVSSLVQQDVLEASWKGQPVSSIEKTKRNGDVVWRATFNNATASDKTKRSLFVYLTITGGFITANYTAQ